MSSRNEETSSRKERRRSTNRVQLEENVFTTQISHYHQTMGYYSGIGPPFIPDRNCYNNINWSSRAPPWTGWTPPPPGTWMTSVSNGGMVPTPQPYPCRVPTHLPPSPFNPPAMTPQPTPVIDPLLGSMHSPVSTNLRGWYARYPNDIPIQDVPMVVPSGQLDNIECLRHVGNHIRADHNFVEKALMQKCETTASVCGTTVTRRSWYKMPEKSPPQPTKEKAIMKSSDKMENINAVEMAILPSKVKKMEDAVILSSDYCAKLSNSNLSSKSSNCLAEVPNHDASSNNFTEYFLKRLMKKHQKESNMKKIPVSDAITSAVQSANIQTPNVLPEKRLSHIPIPKHQIRNSHPSKIGNRIIEDVIDLSRDSPPSPGSKPNPTTTTSHNNNTTNNKMNYHKNETAASCDLVITNSYSLSFSGVGNKSTNVPSSIGARLSPTKRKLPDTKPSTLEDNQKENLIVSDSISDYQMKLTDGRSKRKKYEPRKRDSFVIEDDTPCWVSGTMNKLIDTNFHSNDKNVLTPNIIEKTLPNDHTNKCMTKSDGDNAPEYCDIVDILHSLSESQRVGHTSKKDSLLERKVIQTTNSIRNDKCITLDDTDDSDGPRSGETITPCTVIRSRQSLDTLSTAENSVDSIHDSTLSSSSFDNNDVLEERIPKEDLSFSPVSDKGYFKNKDNPSLNSIEKASSMLKGGNIYFAEKEKVDYKQMSPESGSTKELTKSTWMTLSVAKPSVCKIPKEIPILPACKIPLAIPILPVCKIPKAISILPIKKQPIEQRISDEELETFEALGQNMSVENLAICPKKEGSPNGDKPQNVIIVEVEKRLSENARPIKVWNSSENPISIVDDRLENSEETPSVGNESDDCLSSGHSLSESPLPEGIGSYRKMADKDVKETAAASSKATFIDPQEAGDLSHTKKKQTLDPAPKVSSVADESESNSKSNNLHDDKQMNQDLSRCNTTNSIEIMTNQAVDGLENQKQQAVAPQRQEMNSFHHSVLHVEPVKKSFFPKNNIFTLTTSPPLKNKTTASLTDCNEMVPAGAATLQQAQLEVLNHPKKVLSCNSLKEINQTPCLEISENGDMKVIAIVTDYEESACDNLLGLARPENVLGKNPNVIITAIDSSKKDAVLEYSEHPSGSPFKEFHKSKMPSLADYEKCKNPKENELLFSSFLNCHKEIDVFPQNCNGNIVTMKESIAKTKQLPHFSSQSVQSSEIEDQIVRLEPANSTLGLNIMSVELKQLSSTIEYSADKLVVPLVSTLVANKTKVSPAINNHLLKNQEKTLKRKKKKMKSQKSQNKTKGKTYLKKFKKRKISDKKHQSKKFYRQLKRKSISLRMKRDSVDFRDSLVSCNEKNMEPATDAIKNSKIPQQLASKIDSRTPLAKYDLSILRARISSLCPDRRGRIFRSSQQESIQVEGDTADRVAPSNKQCQTDNPFYGCLTHAFKGSCYQPTERRPPQSIIHKFVKFHGHKLLCVIINVKKYIIVREVVQKCFQGRNQVVFYRTKYRDYSFPYLELPFHMKSFVLKYLLESGNLLTGNRATPMSIMLLSDAEIIYHFFYSFRECRLTACVQDWNSDDTGVYDPNWLKILETTSTVPMKTESPDTSIKMGLSASCMCACNHANNNNFASVLGQCRTAARKPLKRPMSGIFEPSFESPVFGTLTSSSTQTSPPLDTNSSSSSIHTDPVDGVVSTKIIKSDDNPDSTRESNSSTISLEESLVYSNSLLTLSDVDFVSVSSNYCDYVSKPLSLDFVSKTHRNDDDDDNSSSSSTSDPLSSHFSSSSLPFEDPSEEGDDKPLSSLALSDTAQTPDFVLGGMTLLDGKVVRFVELSGQRHFLLTDINSSWTLSAILDSLLESEIVVHRCTPSERSFVLNLNRSLPQEDADEMLLIADESFPRLKTCLSLTPHNNLCHTPPAVHSMSDPEPLKPERQTQYSIESQSEQNPVYTEEQR